MASTQVLNGGPKDVGKVKKKKKKKNRKQQQLISPNPQTTGEDTITKTVPQLFELTDECHHYTARNQIEYDIQKYWEQRYSIWSLYDDGIYMTDDAWFGVTPEPVAKYTLPTLSPTLPILRTNSQVAKDFAALVPASRTMQPYPLGRIHDAVRTMDAALYLPRQSDVRQKIEVVQYCMMGASKAMRWSGIIAIEKNPSVLACAYHNAQIYGVADRITWVNDDSFAYLASNASSLDPSTTAVFASPPWGGPGYRDDEIFNLSKMQPYPLGRIHDAVRTMDAALYLPRQSDVRQVARLAPEGKKIEVVQYCMMGASKAMVAYIPAASPPS
ncbi:RNA cap guanine-N2 methyltransferase [Diplocarpon rosae]|nr:RNA cap guanine-N2 methyltransferase [Diplocarpon rosae]